MNIGARIAKTGIAITLALVLCDLFHFDTKAFAAIAAFLAVQPSIHRSWKHLWNQIQANVIGAAVAFTTLYFFGTGPLVTGVVVILLISLNTKLKLDGIGLSIVTAIAILEVQDPDFLHFGLARFFTVLLGIGSSIFVNIVFFPPKYEKKLHKQIKRTSEEISTLLRSLTHGELEREAYIEAKETVVTHLNRSEELFTLYKDEFNGWFRKKSYQHAKKLVVYQQFVGVMTKELEAIEHFDYTSVHASLLTTEQREDIHEFLLSITSYDEKLLLKLDGKIKLSYPDELNDSLLAQSKRMWSHLLPEAQPLLLHTEEDLQRHAYLFSLVSSLSVLSGHLERLDRNIEHIRRRIPLS